MPAGGRRALILSVHPHLPIYTAGFGTLQSRLPGFIGPFPPPLLIRVIKLSLLSYQVFPVCQYGFSGFAEKSVAPSENCADVPPVQKLYMTFFL